MDTDTKTSNGTTTMDTASPPLGPTMMKDPLKMSNPSLLHDFGFTSTTTTTQKQQQSQFGYTTPTTADDFDLFGRPLLLSTPKKTANGKGSSRYRDRTMSSASTEAPTPQCSLGGQYWGGDSSSCEDEEDEDYQTRSAELDLGVPPDSPGLRPARKPFWAKISPPEMHFEVYEDRNMENQTVNPFLNLNLDLPQLREGDSPLGDSPESPRTPVDIRTTSYRQRNCPPAPGRGRLTKLSDSPQLWGREVSKDPLKDALLQNNAKEVRRLCCEESESVMAPTIRVGRRQKASRGAVPSLPLLEVAGSQLNAGYPTTTTQQFVNNSSMPTMLWDLPPPSISHTTTGTDQDEEKEVITAMQEIQTVAPTHYYTHAVNYALSVGCKPYVVAEVLAQDGVDVNVADHAEVAPLEALCGADWVMAKKKENQNKGHLIMARSDGEGTMVTGTCVDRLPRVQLPLLLFAGDQKKDEDQEELFAEELAKAEEMVEEDAIAIASMLLDHGARKGLARARTLALAAGRVRLAKLLLNWEKEKNMMMAMSTNEEEDANQDAPMMEENEDDMEDEKEDDTPSKKMNAGTPVLSARPVTTVGFDEDVHQRLDSFLQQWQKELADNDTTISTTGEPQQQR